MSLHTDGTVWYYFTSINKQNKVLIYILHQRAYKCDIRNSYEIFNCYLNDVVFEMIIIHENKMVEYDKLLRNDSFFEIGGKFLFHCNFSPSLKNLNTHLKLL